MWSSQQRPTTSPQVSLVPGRDGQDQSVGKGKGPSHWVRPGKSGHVGLLSFFDGIVRVGFVSLALIPLPSLFPGVAPFSGAATGTGGRIRDVQCTGRGAHVVAGTAGYCFGNLHIPGSISFLSTIPPSRFLSWQALNTFTS